MASILLEFRNFHFENSKDALFIKPVSEHDHAIAEKLVEQFECVGCGRNPETGKLLHVRIPLSRC